MDWPDFVTTSKHTNHAIHTLACNIHASLLGTPFGDSYVMAAESTTDGRRSLQLWSVGSLQRMTDMPLPGPTVFDSGVPAKTIETIIIIALCLVILLPFCICAVFYYRYRTFRPWASDGYGKVARVCREP